MRGRSFRDKTDAFLKVSLEVARITVSHEPLFPWKIKFEVEPNGISFRFNFSIIDSSLLVGCWQYVGMLSINCSVYESAALRKNTFVGKRDWKYENFGDFWSGWSFLLFRSFFLFFFLDILKSKKFQRWKQKSKKQEEVLYCSVHSVYKPLEKFSWKKWIPSRDFSIGANISIRIIIFRRCIDLGDTDGWQG